MIVLATDTLTFFLRRDGFKTSFTNPKRQRGSPSLALRVSFETASNHPRVVERMQATTDEIAITIVSRIETLQGRFDTLMKAADGITLQRGQRRLDEAELLLAKIPMILPIDAAAAAEFDRLRPNKKLKKVGRGDLLIAAITLAHRATLVTRNVKDFRQVPGLRVANWID